MAGVHLVIAGGAGSLHQVDDIHPSSTKLLLGERD